MLCSNCNLTVRPVVALDVDGTLGDYHGHFIDFANAYLNVQVSRWYDGTQTFKSWFLERTECTEAEWGAAKLAYRQGGMKRTMPILLGAQALAQSIRGRGAELWITTTRPYLSLDNIVPDTVEWLRRHRIEYDGMLFDEDKYSQLAERIDDRRVIAILDDLPEMYDAAAKVFNEDVPMLVMGQYNYGVRRPLMCDLDSALDIVASRIQWWKEGPSV